MLRLRVKKVLAEKKISQGKLSRGADLPATTVRCLVHGTKYIPSALTLDKVARLLGVSVESLYYDDGEPPTPKSVLALGNEPIKKREEC